MHTDDVRLVDGIVDRFDLEPLFAALDRRSDELVAAVCSAVRSAVAAHDTRALLTLTVTRRDGTAEILQPTVSREYAQALVTFARNRERAGETTTAAAEAVVDDAVRGAVVAFYDSPGAVDALTAELTGRLRDDTAVLGLVAARFRELQGTVGGAVPATSTRIRGSLGSLVGSLAATAAARSVAVAPVRAVVGQSVLGAAAAGGLQGTAAAAGKHAAATAAVKSGLAKVAGLAGGHLLLGPVMVAVVAAVLVHEYRAFPAKMADRVAADLERELAGRAAAMHRDFLLGYARTAAGAYVASFRGLVEHVARAEMHGLVLDDDALARLVDEYHLVEC